MLCYKRCIGGNVVGFLYNRTLKYGCGLYMERRMNLGEELLKTIQIMINRKLQNYSADRTYKTVIKRIDKNGYVIVDESGSERTVPCGIPNVELKPMQSVYVKEPMGKLNELHICNVVGNINSSNGRSRRR